MLKGEAEWSVGVNTKHSLELDLDVDVGGFLASKTDQEAIVEIAMQEEGVRKKVFQIFAENVVPYIFQSQDVSVEGTLNYNAQTKWKNLWRIENDQGIIVRNKLHMLLTLETDRPVTSPQAAYANRGGLASNLTQVVMSALKKHFLGVDSEKFEDSSRMRNDFVLRHNSRNTSETRNDN